MGQQEEDSEQGFPDLDWSRPFHQGIRKRGSPELLTKYIIIEHLLLDLLFLL